MMVIVMIVSIVYLEHRSFMVIYGHIMPYLVISLIISLKNHESPCNLVFFWVSTKSHTQKRQAKLSSVDVTSWQLKNPNPAAVSDGAGVGSPEKLWSCG